MSIHVFYQVVENDTFFRFHTKPKEYLHLFGLSFYNRIHRKGSI